MNHEEVWTLDLVDDTVELPGWVLVPEGLSGAAREQWLAQMIEELTGTPAWDGRPLVPDEIRSGLTQAMDQRDQSPSLALFQVWPPFAEQFATVHVDIVLSEVLPTWSETDAVVHSVDAPHLGPGVQVVTRRRIDLENDVSAELTSLAFVFDNGGVSVLVGLHENLSPLVAAVMPAVVLLMRNLRVVDSDAGTTFVALAPAGLVADESWQMGETG